MPRLCAPAPGVLFATLLAAAAGPVLAAQPGDFTVSIDRPAWKKWGLEYAVTYVFDASGLSSRTAVLRRDADSQPWKPLERKTAGDFFNGVPCVRFDQDRARAYVSVGFQTGERIQLRFVDAGTVTYHGVAPYYDARKAACTLSNDNWGRQQTAHAGAAWKGATDDASDKYQASVHVCRSFHLPVSVGINSRMQGGDAIWQRMQEELDHGDRSWEPAVHTRHHPSNAKAYQAGGYKQEIVGCRDDILEHLHGIAYGQHVFEFILPSAYQDDEVQRAAAGEFLFVRDWNGRDNLGSTGCTAWNAEQRYYGIGGRQTKSYDAVMEARRPKGRYYAADVAVLNRAFDKVCGEGGIFYAMWHADRYQNSVLYDPRPGVDGVAGSTLVQHFAHVANRRDVWYVANGWLYSYRFVAERARVSGGGTAGQSR